MIDHPAIAAFIHALFEYSSIALGLLLYRRQRQARGQGDLIQAGTFGVVVGLLVGAGLGNKLVFVLERPDILSQWLDGHLVMPGQSIVGGLLGGLIGVETAKRWIGQPQSVGDLMVWPIASGLALGRLGCFIAGLHDDTYGLPTALPWAVDFGDGQPRHPTQLYDLAVVLLLAWAVHDRFTQVPGLAFKLFLSGYLLWRLAIDHLKPVPHAYALGWSGIQWVCAVALILYMPTVITAWQRQRCLTESEHARFST